MELLIAGGGPAALEGALAVQRLAGERVSITLLSDRDEPRPLKQGGLATQQADAAAAAIAAAGVEATAYRPVLRAMLLTGGRPRYVRHAPGDAGCATDDAPWWPPHKIAGRELAPYLTAHPEFLIEPVPS